MNARGDEDGHGAGDGCGRGPRATTAYLLPVLVTMLAVLSGLACLAIAYLSVAVLFALFKGRLAQVGGPLLLTVLGLNGLFCASCAWAAHLWRAGRKK